MTTKYVTINFKDEKSLVRAEKRKSKLENEGYHHKKTEQTGFNKFVSTICKCF